jgi:hypothetical protein
MAGGHESAAHAFAVSRIERKCTRASRGKDFRHSQAQGIPRPLLLAQPPFENGLFRRAELAPCVLESRLSQVLHPP